MKPGPAGGEPSHRPGYRVSIAFCTRDRLGQSGEATRRAEAQSSNAPARSLSPGFDSARFTELPVRFVEDVWFDPVCGARPLPCPVRG